MDYGLYSLLKNSENREGIFSLHKLYFCLFVYYPDVYTFYGECMKEMGNYKYVSKNHSALVFLFLIYSYKIQCIYVWTEVVRVNGYRFCARWKIVRLS